MLYKNIADRPVLILQNSMKTWIPSGAIINLNIHDLKHSGSSLRFFESVSKAEEVKHNGWHQIDIETPA